MAVLVAEVIPQNPTNYDIIIMLVRIDTKLDNLSPKVDNLEVRVSLLERRRWPLPSLGVLSGLIGAGAGFLALMR